MSIKDRLATFIKESEETEGNKPRVGVQSITADELTELLDSVNEDGEIEIDGTKIKIAGGLDTDELSDEVKSELLKELLSNMDEETFSKMVPREVKIEMYLNTDEIIEKTNKLTDFLVENDIDFTDLIALTLNIGMAGLTKETRELLGHKTEMDYIDYLDSLQLEMKASQILTPTTRPAVNVEDIALAGLLSAFDSLTFNRKMVEHLLMTQRLATIRNPERVNEIGDLKFNLAKEVQELGNSFDSMEEILDLVDEQVKEKTGLSAYELHGEIMNGASTKEIVDKLNTGLKDNQSFSSKQVC